MKKIITLLASLLLLGGMLPAMAQYVPDWYEGDLKKKGTRIALDGNKLDKATTQALLYQVGGQDMVSQWLNYAKARGTGIGLTVGGYSVAAAGAVYGGVYFLGGLVATIFVAIGGQEAVDNLWSELGPRVWIGGATMVTGLTVGTVGAVKTGRNNRKMKNIVSSCNAAGLPASQKPVSLQFGSAPSGIGLTLNF